MNMYRRIRMFFGFTFIFSLFILCLLFIKLIWRKLLFNKGCSGLVLPSILDAYFNVLVLIILLIDFWKSLLNRFWKISTWTCSFTYCVTMRPLFFFLFNSVEVFINVVLILKGFAKHIKVRTLSSLPHALSWRLILNRVIHLVTANCR
jgi:hypothetical protein